MSLFQTVRYREHSIASIFVLLLGLRGHSPKSGLGAAAGKTETERVKSDESGTISASGKYIKGKLFNRKNVSCDRKCMCARARVHIYGTCIRIYLSLPGDRYFLASRISSTLHRIVYNFSYQASCFPIPKDQCAWTRSYEQCKISIAC